MQMFYARRFYYFKFIQGDAAADVYAKNRA